LPPAQIQQLQQEFYLLMIGSTLPGKTAVIDNESYPIFVKGVSQNLTSVEQAQALRIGYPQSVPLANLANVAIQELPSHVNHTDTTLSASITASSTEKNLGAVNMAIQKEIDALSSHPGVDVKMAGVAEQMGDTFSRMGIAIIIAIIIVFLIVILMMRSVRNPLMIMVSLPLASIGALVALAISRYTISVSAMMGVLMLVGIVLTNAIVLITLVEHLRKSGLATQDALLEGGKTRLRPILMTALTTIFAMIPMAIGVGSGSILNAELAVVVIGGLFSSTLLTLFVIPVIYSLAHRRQPEPVTK
jgi:hydrophobic/amphiphilic exporter-1 (mainly G- bacteria), HAE1 family